MPKQLDKELQRIILDMVVKLGNQARVAEHLGVDQATVSRWIAGRQGMDVGQCLRMAKLTQHDVADILIWANHDPDDYLERTGLPPLSSDAQEIQERLRILEWERQRSSLPEHLKPMLDSAVSCVITSYQQAIESDHQQRREANEPRPRSRRRN